MFDDVKIGKAPWKKLSEIPFKKIPGHDIPFRDRPIHPPFQRAHPCLSNVQVTKAVLVPEKVIALLTLDKKNVQGNLHLWKVDLFDF